MYLTLSSPNEAMLPRYDAVVIGSGYGGAIAASRLARAGRSVCLLERGAERPPGTYPQRSFDLVRDLQVDTPWFRVGSRSALFDFRYNKDINVILGCGLGGTSLINAGISLRPDPEVFKNVAWPPELREPDAWARYFDHADRMLRPSIAPATYRRVRRAGEVSEPLAKPLAVRVAAQHSGWNASPAPVLVNFERFDGDRNHVGVTQRPCVGCGDCVSGCNYHAKNTLLMNYLPDAKRHGAHIFTRARAAAVSRAAHGWTVHGHTPRGPFTVAADVVILAAGTLGSTEILLRSRQRGLPLSGRLGHRFSGNGDTIGFAYNNERVVNGIGLGPRNPRHREPVGPCSTVMVDLRPGRPVEQSMVMADGVVPGAMAAVLPMFLTLGAAVTGRRDNAGLWSRTRAVSRVVKSNVLGAYKGATRNTLFVLLMSHDRSEGRMYLDGDRLRVQWPGIGREPQFRIADETLFAMSQALGGTYVPNPVWNDVTRRSLATGHPLGGCAMAEDAAGGVVDHCGQVFTGEPGGGLHDGLFVMDGAVVPTALGVNPLLTIAALAERSCALLTEQAGWTIDYD